MLQNKGSGGRQTVHYTETEVVATTIVQWQFHIIHKHGIVWQISNVQQSSTTILYCNARIILPKPDELHLLCGDFSFHIVCIVETWLDDFVRDNELIISSYFLVRLNSKASSYLQRPWGAAIPSSGTFTNSQFELRMSWNSVRSKFPLLCITLL